MLVICRTLGCVVVILMRPAKAFCASSYITFSSSENERLEFKCRLSRSRTERVERARVRIMDSLSELVSREHVLVGANEKW